MSRNNVILTGFLTFLLSACGGGGDGATGGTPESIGTPMTEEAFIASISSGILRFDTDVDLSSFSTEFTVNGQTYVTTTSGSVNSSQVLSVLINNDNTATVDACGLEAPVTENISLISLSDGDDISLAGCTTSFFSISETQYRIENSCTGVIPSSTTDVTYISDNPLFNLGEISLDFSLAFYSDSATAAETCGSIASTNTTTSTTGNLLPARNNNETNVKIIAPYVNGNKIILEFTFSATALTAGTFNVVSFLTANVENEVTFRISSNEFGGTAENPVSISPLSGTVTLSSVGTRSFAGSFDVALEGDDSLSGTFALNL